MWHNGTPSAALLFAPMAATAERHGLRLVVSSRPGYGRSSAQPGRRVASVVADTAALLDELGADRFLAVGWSGGGPHALACAALLPDRCAAAAVVAGVAPCGARGLDWPDWLAGMGEENVKEFGAAAAGVGPLTTYLTAEAAGLAYVRGDDVATALGDLVSDVDRRALTDEFADYTAAIFRGAVSGGIDGWRDDDLAFLTGWGFDLGAITTPLSLWQGEQDRMVPYAHGRWLAAALPGATVHLTPFEGHLSLVLNAFDAIVAELAAHLR